MAGQSPPRELPAVARTPHAQSSPIEIKAYRVLARIITPAAGLILRHRERRGKEDPARRPERLGLASQPRPDGELIWVHAASVGEANAVLPLIGHLGGRRPDLTVLLTTGTVTSARSVAPRLPPQTLHQYVPLDAPKLVARFLDHWRPSLGVFTEQEIWPNLIIESGARGIALALVNARMSERSFGSWQRRPRLAQALFSRFAVVLAQNEAYARRFAALGASPVRAAGNLKIDAPPPPADRRELARLEAAVGQRPRLIAASTHEGEEAILAAAHREITRTHPDFLTIIAPRHPDRGEAVVAELQAGGFRVARRSTGALPDPTTEIYVADTIGELGTLYALCPIACIGGSFIPWGGQNPVEAVRHGAAVLSGPNWWNFDDIYAGLLAEGGVAQVRTSGEIAALVTRLIADPDALARMRTGAERALLGLGGALERTVEALLPMLPARGDLARVS